ncbi:hypothetical protein AOQ84DRAFT_384184 [Glonium stellatum]|uniref:Zn(2)-C6 fungal-type domain-containing protein n=1 Tax=Glonium stellatum TaxID=574774 RepID=A0A8E2FDS7_9PEZI|nr:hypothetical protein AOQ84DRAFT_384184 [Glonium stellatum]
MFPPTVPPVWPSRTACCSHPSFPTQSNEDGHFAFVDQSSVEGDFPSSTVPEIAFQVAGMPYTSASVPADRQCMNCLTDQQAFDPCASSQYGVFDDQNYYLGDLTKPGNGYGMAFASSGQYYQDAPVGPSTTPAPLNVVQFAINGCPTSMDSLVPDIEYPVSHAWTSSAQQAASNTSSEMRDDSTDSNLSGGTLDPQESNSDYSVLTADEPAYVADVGSTVQQFVSIINGLQNSGTLDEVRHLRLEVLKKDLEIKELLSKHRASKKSWRRRNNARPTPLTGVHHPSHNSFKSSASDRRLSPSELKAQASAVRVCKRRAFNDRERQVIAETRRIGACLPCRKRKGKCEPIPEDPQGRCVSCALMKLQIAHIPCIRTRIKEVRLYRLGTSENDTWTRNDEIQSNVTELSNLINPRNKKALRLRASKLRQGKLLQTFNSTLMVEATQFAPVRGDVTSYHWMIDGERTELHIPPFALASIKNTHHAVQDYIKRNLCSYVAIYLSGSAIAFRTFKLAIEKARLEEKPFLKCALNLWMATRLIEEPWQIEGNDTLGVQLEETSGTPFNGIIPIPPVMDSQFDQVVIQKILHPLREELLKALDRKISRCKREEWFETFLAVFILLNNIEIATAHDHEFAHFHGHVKPRGSRFEDYNLVEGYFHGAQTLIAHFRDILNGHAPFTADWRRNHPDLLANLSEKEALYFDLLTKDVIKMRDEVESLRANHKYERTLYWCHQLFYQEWDCSPIKIRELSEVESRAGGM